jgi:RNA polymerase sigma-70 factor (sigma-E family)
MGGGTPQARPRWLRGDRTMRDDGDEFGAYVAARQRALVRMAYLLTGDHHTAEDLVQSALARTFAAWRRIRDKGALDSYVRRAVLNEYVNLWRRAWRRFERSTSDVPDRAEPTPVIDGTDMDERLWIAIGALAPRQRAVVVLRYYSDLSEAEIAATLGCSRGTVKSTSSRSLTRLRELLATTAAERPSSSSSSSTTPPSSQSQSPSSSASRSVSRETR